MKQLFTGAGVALVTPMRKGGSIDFSRLGNLIDNVIKCGIDYVVALGTTSEAATMTESERSAVQDFVVESVNGRVPIMLGLGGNCTQNVIDQINDTNFDGIDGILSVAPFYNKPNQRGLAQHFKTISETSPVPVVIYNVPGRTSCNIAAETAIQLANECPNIVGIKEASGNISQAMQIIKNKPAGFSVISGDDSLTLPLMSVGAVGVISVVANALPKELAQMVHLAAKGDMKKAADLHYKLLPLMNAIFEEGNPTGIKALLEVSSKGEMPNALRLPLIKASKTLSNKIAALYNEL